MSEPVHVRIGRFALGQSPTLLKATLGSCVGIALLWRQRGVCALAHCLLPEAPASDDLPRADRSPLPTLLDASGTCDGARYVDHAVQHMLVQLGVSPSERRQLRAHLAGGANMQHRAPGSGMPRTVGELNIDAAERALARVGIEIDTREVGGHCARQIWVHCAEPSVTVTQVASPSARPRDPVPEI